MKKILLFTLITILLLILADLVDIIPLNKFVKGGLYLLFGLTIALLVKPINSK